MNHHPIWFVRSWSEFIELIKSGLFVWIVVVPIAIAAVFGVYSENNVLGVIGNGLGLSVGDTRDNLKPAARKIVEGREGDSAAIKERRPLTPSSN